MLTGYQSYSINLSGYIYLAIPPFEISAPDFPTVDKVEIFTRNEKQIAVKIRFNNVPTEQDADSIGTLIAEQVADRLAFKYKVAANDPIKAECSFQRLNTCGSIHVSAASHLTLATVAHSIRKIDASELTTLKPAIEASQPSKDLYYSQFRWVMCQTDPIAKFMNLYKILLSLEGGPNHTQGPVDAFIVGQEPSVQPVFNPHPKVNRNETIYTRLRNEVGHEIPGTTPASTRQGMENHVDRLADHVKTAISRIP